MRLSISFLTLLFFVNLSWAQPTRSVSYETMLEVAEEALSGNDYASAIEYYDKAYKISKDKDLALNVAQLNFLLRDYERASKGYSRVLSRDKNNIYKEDRIMYAKSLKALGMYKEAVAEYNQFIGETEDEEMKMVAQRDLDGIMKSSELEENTNINLDFVSKLVQKSTMTVFYIFPHL